MPLNIDVTPVILCGGSGTRLWPLSRAGFPKQFLALTGTQTLFQQALHRVNSVRSDQLHVLPTLVVTNEEHRFLALDQLRELPSINAELILEPQGKNTAPAMTLAALRAAESGTDPVLVVAPADQTIQDEKAFTSTLERCIQVASTGAIVTLGVRPTHAETGYGYIEHSGQVGRHGEFAVASFTEKPDLSTALSYVEGGKHTWNSGIYVVRASTWLSAIQQFRPDISEATLAAWSQRTSELNFLRPCAKAFACAPKESIDFAVAERCPGSIFEIKSILLDAGWNDLGAWEAVWQVGEKDCDGNVAIGDVLLSDTQNSIVHSSSRLVATVGISDLVIVDTLDALLVTTRERSQDVKDIVKILETSKRDEQTTHRKVHRPWGWYDCIDTAQRFKVKRIQVKPGASLSLQMHHHRAEHWIVVQGTAEVTCGDKVSLLSENQSTYIPLGVTHRLANPGTIPLEIIEVQSGSYLGEDDIIRFEDSYGRG
jgi:mannose-1-phosphate guanylyltransferase/mannose-6-phosphate isomerase